MAAVKMGAQQVQLAVVIVLGFVFVYMFTQVSPEKDLAYLPCTNELAIVGGRCNFLA